MTESMDHSAEREAVLRGVLVRAAPELGTIAVTGPDRASWLGAQLSCDVKALLPGQGSYGLSLSRQGRIQAEVWALCDRGQVLLGVREDLLAGTVAQLGARLVMEDAEIAVAEPARAWWLGFGPRAEALAQVARERGARSALARLGHLDVALVAASREARSEIGAALGAAVGAVLATDRGWEQARLEHALPLLGVDFAIGDYPQEAALERLAVSFTKGCYLGQEVVLKLDKHGHAGRRLVRLRVDTADAPIAAGAAVSTLAGERVGTVSSAAGVGDRWLGFATVPHQHAALGAELSVGGRRAVIVEPPYAPPPRGSCRGAVAPGGAGG